MCHVSCVTFHVSHVMCHLSHVKKKKNVIEEEKNLKLKITIIFVLTFKKFEKLVELVSGGSVINGAYPI